MTLRNELFIKTSGATYERAGLMSLAYGGFQISINSSTRRENGTCITKFKFVARSSNGNTIAAESWGDIIAKVDAAR